MGREGPVFKSDWQAFWPLSRVGHMVPPFLGFAAFSPVYRRDRDHHGGRVLLLVREGFFVHRYSDLETSRELLWVELCTKRGPLFLGVFYRPPKDDVSTLQELNNSLQLLSANSNIVLFADFNAPHIDWSLISSVISTPVHAHSVMFHC